MYWDDFFRSYWWLLFPIGFFVFGAWDRWLTYKRSRDHLELLKSYQAQGKEPPPELVKAAADPYAGDAWGGPPPPNYAHPYYWSGRRAWRRYYRWGPYWQWRSAFVTGAVAVGFWVASEYADIPGTYDAFRLVAIIMSFVAVGNLLGAIFASTFRGR
ncbi:MAG: hypothetical protein KGO51_13525 [Alphaproteobacteria bacterium]|nr:hypothetical protein [Alphaproteobacteria bacterium]